MKNRDKILHDLLDGADPEWEASVLQGPDAERLSRYRDSLSRLESHQEQAPADFTSRVMTSLPDKPSLSWADKLKSFWPERRLWTMPALSGALAMLFLMAGLTFFRSPENTGLVPVILDLYAPSAKQVELVGTFSNWAPKALRLKGPGPVGFWAIAVKLPPGRYEYAFLVNGSQLVPDDDGEALRPDGFGGENSLLLLKTAGWNLDQDYGFTSDDYVVIPEIDPEGTAPSLPDGNRGQWRTILDRGVASDVKSDAMETIVAYAASADISPEQALIILEPLFQDAQAGNHTPYILRKTQECILKKGRSDTLKAITQARHEAFKEARILLARTGQSASITSDPALLDATAFALESGQDPSFLQEVLSMAKGKSSTQVAAVIEAGETLHHAGLDPESLKLIMKDCLQKDLDSQQIKRVTEQVKEKLIEGSDHKIIYDELWV